jgi:hypothetical protein
MVSGLLTGLLFIVVIIVNIYGQKQYIRIVRYLEKEYSNKIKPYHYEPYVKLNKKLYSSNKQIPTYNLLPRYFWFYLIFKDIFLLDNWLKNKIKAYRIFTFIRLIVTTLFLVFFFQFFFGLLGQFLL